jgi:hypothetical protein
MMQVGGDQPRISRIARKKRKISEIRVIRGKKEV